MIAVVGMACRFPQAASIEAYWKLLVDGVEAVREPPRDRGELAPPPWLVAQAPSSRRGGYLDRVDQFEPAFFRISPREAAKLDPQQRLLLEVSWEALEDAGHPAASLAGSTTGVFVGVMNADFSRRASRDDANIDAQLGPGSSLGIAPNRVSYTLDLHGPSMAIDTLCSSSLVAVHLACQSLLADESSPIAIAGGVNVILDRTMDAFYARAGLLSKEGRCRAFDAQAAGIVRGEGCGLVVLKKLSRALADGDRIHAVIRGSAVNQDGRSNGLTAPNRWAQEEVLRAAYRRAEISPASVAYVEAHGTGTLIGDPIETAALGAVLGEGRDRTLAIGSVKSNLGHLESAAGIASLLKAVLALKHRTLPPSLHFEQANPYARFEERQLRVPTAAEPWQGELVAGVSSFGMGGTNAHVVLGQEAPAHAELEGDVRGSSTLALIPISARSAAALDAIDTRLTELLRTCDPRDLAHSFSLRRDHHDHRRAIVAFGGERLSTTSGTFTPGHKPTLVFVLPRGADRTPIATWKAIGIEPDEIVQVDETTARPTVCVYENGIVHVELSPFRLASRELFLQAVGSLYCLGFAIDWRALDPGGRFVSVGSYPWQRESFVAPFLSAPSPERARATGDGASPLPVLVPRWEPSALPNAAATRDGWHVIDNDSIASELERAGHRVTGLDRAQNIVAFSTDLAPTIRLVQQLASRDVRLWLVTRGACVVDGSESLDALASSSVWGFGRVVMNEHPRLRCRLIDFVGEPDALVRELVAGDETEVAIRGTTRYVARLERRRLSPSPWQCRDDAAYLVTGGLGGLGLAAARRLVERGATTLVLASRRGMPTDEVRALGANVFVEQVDVADRAALASVLQRHRVRGVIHAAGVMTPSMIATIDPSSLHEALRAKVDGARNLHELTHDLEFFVLYSSIATLLGTPGQGVYAAANAYLDELAAYRRSQGLAATSIAWTVIEGAGMAAHASEKALGQLRDRGIPAMSLPHANDLLEHALVDTPARFGAVDFDLERWTRFYPHASSLRRFVPLRSTKPPEEVERFRESTRDPAGLENFLRDTLASILGDATPDPRRPLSDLGVDSLAAVELAAAIKTELGISLPTDRFLGTITLRELAAELTTPKPLKPRSLRDDAVLEPSLHFAPRTPAPPRDILLTGATGFLGAFILGELLDHTQANIHCLVRGADGFGRLERNLARYGVPALQLARVTCIAGDLSKPNLGIGSLDVDTIIHNGASVNFVHPYESLKPDNVDGTREILRLTSALGARLHYVSTIGVFPAGAQPTVLERAEARDPDRLALGYMRAKWVAEQLVMQACDRGLDVSIYRPGTITGHSKTGAFNPEDFVCALIKGCVQLGIAPSVDVPINLAPVDYVGRALVKIALDAAPGTYHLVGRNLVAWNQLAAWLRELGYQLDELPYRAWRDVLLERALPTRNALAPLLPLFQAHDDTEWLHLPTYDDANARRATGFACPEIDAALLRTYVERFVIDGYLPRPRKLPPGSME